jgi:LSD1 subclass zinc finger protein
MASLWYQTGSGSWTPWLLDSAAVALGPRLLPMTDDDGGAPSALLLCSRGAGPEQWLAMRVAARPLFVNGEPLVTGIRAISDRDELRLAGSERVFFSAEELPRIEPFTAGPREVLCPRCRRVITPGALTVRCGTCKTAFHQETDPRFRCYTYGAACPVCARPTALTETYRWQPEA